MERNETCEIVQPELNNERCSSDSSASESEESEEEIDKDEINKDEINNNNKRNNKAVIKNPKRVMFANVMDATDLVVSSERKDNDVTNDDNDSDNDRRESEKKSSCNGKDKV